MPFPHPDNSYCPEKDARVRRSREVIEKLPPAPFKSAPHRHSALKQKWEEVIMVNVYFAFIIDFVQEMALVWEELQDFNNRNEMSCNYTFEWHRHNHAMRIKNRRGCSCSRCNRR